MKLEIFADGLGARLSEETTVKPKAAMEFNGLTHADFEGTKYMRFKKLQENMDNGALSADLHWVMTA